MQQANKTLRQANACQNETIKDFEFINKFLGPDGFSGDFTKHFKELTSILYNLFQKQNRREHFSTYFTRPVLP